MSTLDLVDSLPKAPKISAPRASRTGGGRTSRASGGNGRAAGETDEERAAEAAAKAQARQIEIGQRFADELQHEADLRGMTIKQQEVAIALYNLERAGVEKGSAAYALFAGTITRAAEARGDLKQQASDARDYADSLKDVGSALRNATSDFRELFGTAGAGFSSLIGELTSYGEKQADIAEKVAEARANQSLSAQQLADFESAASEQSSRNQIDHYGNLLSASKHFFSEKSKGYKVLEAAEKAYRIYQTISAAIEAINSARSIAMDTAKTASSVANSATRASADGIAAFAKTLASLPFPLNLVAGAAVLAALVAVGVKIAGGGGKSASATATSSKAAELTSDAQSSPYSTLPGAGGLYDPRNAGLTPGAVAANDNRNRGMIVAPVYNITAPGADAGTVEQIRQVLDSHQADTVAKARSATIDEIAAQSRRQRLGR